MSQAQVFGLGLVLSFTDNATTGIAHATQAFTGLSSAVTSRSTAAGITNMAKSMSLFGSAITKSFTVPLGGLATVLARAGMQRATFIQQNQLAWNSLLGDVKTASDYQAELMAFAKQTPFRYETIASGAQNMVAYGIATEKVIPAMRALGDAIGGMGKTQQDLTSVVDVVSRIGAEGGVSARRLLQLQMRGIQADKIIGNLKGFSTIEQAREYMKGMDSGEFITELTKGLEEGTNGLLGFTPKFEGMMMNIKQTWTGAVDSFKSGLVNAGLELIGFYQDAETGTQHFTSLETATTALRSLTDTLKIIGPVFKPLVKDTIDGISNTVISFNRLAKSGMMLIGVAQNLQLLRNGAISMEQFVNAVFTADNPVTELSAKLMQLDSATNGFASKLVESIPQIIKWGSVLGPALLILGKLGALPVIGKAIGGVMDLLTGKFIVTGLASMGAFGSLSKHLQNARTSLNNFRQGITTIADTATQMRARVGDAFTNMLEGFRQAGRNLSPIIQNVFSSFVIFGHQAAGVLGPIFSNVVGNIRTHLTSLAGTFSGIASRLRVSLTGALGNLGSGLFSSLSNGVNHVLNSFTILRTAVDNVRVGFSLLPNSIAGVVSAISMRVSILSYDIQNVVSKAVVGIHSAFSNVAARIPAPIRNAFSTITQSIGVTARSIAANLPTALRGVGAAFKSMGSIAGHVLSGIGKMASTAVKGVAAIGKGAISVGKTVGSALGKGLGFITKLGTGTLATGGIFAALAGKSEGGLDNFANNIQEKLSNVTKNLGPMTQQLTSQISQTISGVSAQMPQLLTALQGAAQTIVAELPGIISQLAPLISQLLPQLFGVMTTVGPQLISVGATLVQGLVQGIVANAPALAQGFGQMFNSLVGSLSTTLPVLGNLALDLLDTLGNALVQNGPTLATKGVELITNFINGLISFAPRIAEVGGTLIRGLLTTLQTLIPQLLVLGGQLIANLVTGIITHLPQILQGGVQLILSLIQGITSMAVYLRNNFGEILKGLWEKIKEIDWLQLGKDIIKAIFNGIKSIGKGLWNLIKSLITGKDYSADGQEVGQEVGQGIEQGIQGSSGGIAEATNSAIAGASAGVNTAPLANKFSGTGQEMADNLNTEPITSKINGAVDQSETAADTISQNINGAAVNAKGEIDISANTTQAQTDINAMIGQVGQAQQINITANATEAQNTIQTVIDQAQQLQYLNPNLTVSVYDNASQTALYIDEVVNGISTQHNTDVVATDSATSIIQTVTNQLASIPESENTDITTVDKGKMVRDELQKQLEALTSRKYTVTIEQKVTGDKIGQNAEGTNSWVGGLTRINEQGGEIVDLPSGTRIIPHDESIFEAMNQGISMGAKALRGYVADNMTARPIIPTSDTGNISESIRRQTRMVREGVTGSVTNTPRAGDDISKAKGDQYDYSISFAEGSIVLQVEKGSNENDYRDIAEYLLKYAERYQQKRAMANRKSGVMVA